MDKLMILVTREYLQRVRTRSFIISTLLAPALMALMFIGPALLIGKTGSTVRRVVAVDESGGEILRLLDEQLAGDRYADPLSGSDEFADAVADEGESRRRIELIPYAGTATGREAIRAQLAPQVEADEFDGLIVLGENFREDGVAWFYGSDPSGVVWADEMEDGLARVRTSMGLSELGLDVEQLDELMAGADLQRLHIADAEASEADMGVRFIVGFVMIFLLYMMILMYGIQAMQGIIEDKASRVVEVMLASVTPTQLMAGKILGAAAVGLTQFAIWAGVGLALVGQSVVSMPFDVNLSVLSPGLWLSFGVFFLLGFLMYSSLYAAIGALCTSTQDAQQFQTPITMLIVIPMILLQVVMRDPDSILSVVLSLIPLFTPIMMFMRVVLGSPPVWQVAASIFLLAGTVVFLSKFTGKLFRLAILSYGKAPSYGEVFKMLRAPE